MALHIYGDESGEVGGRHFLIGLLYVASKSRSEYERQLQRVKLEKKFTHKELHYSELSRLKADCAKAVVDWYFAAHDVEFRCTVVPGGIFDHTRFRDNLKFMSSRTRQQISPDREHAVQPVDGDRPENQHIDGREQPVPSG